MSAEEDIYAEGRHLMSKTGRKRRARRKKAANHGKRPNT
jgi:hypothetical protein